MSWSLLEGDALTLPLADGSVDLIVTSPPYFALRSYQDDEGHYEGQIGSEPTPQDFLEALWAVTAECRRVLKPSGSLWVNLGDKYAGSSGSNNNGSGGSTLNIGPNPETTRTVATHAAPVSVRSDIRAKSLMGMPWRYAIGLIDGQAGDPWILRAEVVWSKPNGLPESVTDRVRRSHEQWFHFTKEPRYFSAVDEIREPHTTPLHTPGKQATNPDRNDNDRADRVFGHPLGKLPGSVWSIPSEPLVVPDWARDRYDLPDHFAAFPTEWPRRLILGWSPPGICEVCGEGRRPDVGTDWSKIPHQMVEKRVLSTAAAAEWCSMFADYCDDHGITRRNLDEACGTSDMGGWWASRLPHRSQVPTPEQWERIKDAHGAMPPHLDDPVYDTEIVPVAEWDTPNQEQAGRHQTTKPAVLSSGEYRTITGYVCACPTPDAPTRPAVVLDPFGGTGTVALVADALGRHGISLDMSSAYNRLARWRITESGHASKARTRTNLERQQALL